MAILVTDSFTRADSPNSLGSTDGAGTEDPHTWTQNSGGHFGIISNQVYRSAAGPVAFGVATVDPRTADVTVEVTVSALHTGGNAGLVFRAVDGLNYWVFFLDGSTSNVQIGKVTNGGFTNVATTAVTKAAGDVLKIECSGDQITRYHNGVSLGTTTDSTYETATRHGLWINGGGTAWRLSGFSIDGTQQPAPRYYLSFEFGPDETDTGGTNHLARTGVRIGPDTGSTNNLGHYISLPESGNDGTREWLEVVLALPSSVFSPGRPSRVLFGGADTYDDAAHYRRVRILDAAKNLLLQPAYPRTFTYTADEQDGTGLPNNEMGHSGTAGSEQWNAETDTVDVTGSTVTWHFGPSGWRIGAVAF